MFDLIPSNYMKEIFNRTRFELTDFNKATILWNIPGKEHVERIEALKELSNATKDDDLKKQISERIQYEKNMLDRLKANPDGKFVYVVNDSNDCGCGFFANYSMAYEYGVKYCKRFEEKQFSVSKQMIMSVNDGLIVRNPGRTNWYMFDKEQPEEDKYCATWSICR